MGGNLYKKLLEQSGKDKTILQKIQKMEEFAKLKRTGTSAVTIHTAPDTASSSGHSLSAPSSPHPPSISCSGSGESFSASVVPPPLSETDILEVMKRGDEETTKRQRNTRKP